MPDRSSFTASSSWLTDSLSPLASSESTSSSVGSLATLTTERVLLPDHHSPRAKALAFCKRIDHVKVRSTEKINGHTHYAVEIFFKKAQSNIPTTTKRQLEVPLTGGTPDVVRKRRFSVFSNLRHEMYFHAGVGHGDRLCAFCASMTELLSDGPTLPRLRLKLFHGNSSLCHALEGFVNSVLALTSSLPSTSSRRLCDGLQEIPLLLQNFLMDETEEAVPTSVRLPETASRATRKSRSRTMQ